MSILQAVGKGFSQSGKLVNIVIIFFALNFIMGLLVLPFSGPDNAGNPQAVAFTLVISLLSVLLFIFVQGGALAAIKDLLKNNSFAMSDFVNNGKKYYIKILGLFLLILAIVLVLVLIMALIASGILALANTVLVRSLVTAIVVLISLAAVVLFLFPIYSVVVDEAGPVAALKKGINIGKSNFWKTLGLFLVMLIAAFVIAFIVGIITALITGALPPGIGQVIMLFINSIVQSYLSIVMMVAFMAFYLGLTQGAKTEEGPSAI